MRVRADSFETAISGSSIRVMTKTKVMNYVQKLHDESRKDKIPLLVTAIKTGRILVSNEIGEILQEFTKSPSTSLGLKPERVTFKTPSPIPGSSPRSSVSLPAPVTSGGDVTIRKGYEGGDVTGDAYMAEKLIGYIPVEPRDYHLVSPGSRVRYTRASDGKFILGGEVLTTNTKSNLYVIRPHKSAKVGKFGVKWSGILTLWKKIEAPIETSLITKSNKKENARIDKNTVVLSRHLKKLEDEITSLKKDRR